MSTLWTLSCAGNFLLDVPRKPQKYVASKDLHLSGCEMKKMIGRKKYASVLPYYMAALLHIRERERERILLLQTHKSNVKLP